MNQSITSETLFEYFVEQIEVSVDAVATQLPYTPQKIVSISFTLVEKLGLYYDGAKEWRRELSLEKTWDNFNEFFDWEFHKVYAIPRTAQAAGYAQFYAASGQANAVVQE